MPMRTLTLAPVCTVDQIPLGLGRAFRVGDKTIGVFRNRGGKVFAVNNVCPHKGGPLTDGMIVGDEIVCPLHAYRFDGESGQCASETICTLEAYTVEIHNGTIHVGVEGE